MNAPCYLCEERTLLCHDTCDRYRAWLQKHLETTSKEREDRRGWMMANQIHRKAVEKAKKGQ